jgi:hypothetical protein
LARKYKTGILEFWDFIDAYADFSTDEGLVTNLLKLFFPSTLKTKKGQQRLLSTVDDYLGYSVCSTSGLYYKPMTIVNYDSRVVNMLETSLTDDNRVVIYDRHMLIVQATDQRLQKGTRWQKSQ